ADDPSPSDPRLMSRGRQPATARCSARRKRGLRGGGSSRAGNAAGRYGSRTLVVRPVPRPSAEYVLRIRRLDHAESPCVQNGRCAMRTLMSLGLLAALAGGATGVHADEALRSQALQLFGQLKAPSALARESLQAQ